MSREKIVFVLIDGIGDVSVPALGHRTPLQAATTPFMDAIAAAGLNGLLDPVAPGLACGSDTAHLSLFGYDPRGCYRGRGAFESLGAGLPMTPGDIAFKANFATVDDATGVVVSRRADRRFELEGPRLCNALDNLPIPGFPELTLRVRYATEHRAGVVISGPGLSDAIRGTDPLRDGLPLVSPAAIHPGDTLAERTASVVQAASDAIRGALRSDPINNVRAAAGKQPANVMLLRGCGGALDLPSFLEQHGLRAAVVAPTRIIRGLARTLAMTVLDVPSATGDYHTDLAAKAAAAADALLVPCSGKRPAITNSNANEINSETFDFVFLHVKAVDDAGHDGWVSGKKELLQAADIMVGQLLRRLSDHLDHTEDMTVVITGDHSTPVASLDHSCEPVPIAMAHLHHVVEILGGKEALQRSAPLDPISLPDPSLSRCEELLKPESLRINRRTVGDRVVAFDEVSAAGGGLGRFPGAELMNLILEFARWSKKTANK